MKQRSSSNMSMFEMRHLLKMHLVLWNEWTNQGLSLGQCDQSPSFHVLFFFWGWIRPMDLAGVFAWSFLELNRFTWFLFDFLWLLIIVHFLSLPGATAVWDIWQTNEAWENYWPNLDHLDRVACNRWAILLDWTEPWRLMTREWWSYVLHSVYIALVTCSLLFHDMVCTFPWTWPIKNECDQIKAYEVTAHCIKVDVWPQVLSFFCDTGWQWRGASQRRDGQYSEWDWEKNWWMEKSKRSKEKWTKKNADLNVHDVEQNHRHHFVGGIHWDKHEDERVQKSLG